MDRNRDIRPPGSLPTPSDLSPLAVRVLSKAAAGPSACLVWTGHVDPGGYGTIKIGGESRVVHRVSYEEMVGPIPPGMQIDHLCHSEATNCTGGTNCLHRRCINPAHLEPVTPRENSRRTHKARKTHCVNGHLFDEANTHIRPNGTRRCKKCHAEQGKRSKAKSRATSTPVVAPTGGSPHTHLTAQAVHAMRNALNAGPAKRHAIQELAERYVAHLDGRPVGASAALTGDANQVDAWLMVGADLARLLGVGSGPHDTRLPDTARAVIAALDAPVDRLTQQATVTGQPAAVALLHLLSATEQAPVVCHA